GMAFNGEDASGYAAENGRAIAGSRADLQHRVPGPDLGPFDHQRHDVGLGYGLALADRQRRILVSGFPHALVDNAFAWNGGHGLKHRRIGNPAAAELLGDHAPACWFKQCHGTLLSRGPDAPWSRIPAKP